MRSRPVVPTIEIAALASDQLADRQRVADAIGTTLLAVRCSIPTLSQTARKLGRSAPSIGSTSDIRCKDRKVQSIDGDPSAA